MDLMPSNTVLIMDGFLVLCLISLLQMVGWRILFACLLASSIIAEGVYVIDYLERDIADTFNFTNETEPGGEYCGFVRQT